MFISIFYPEVLYDISTGIVVNQDKKLKSLSIAWKNIMAQMKVKFMPF